MKVKGGANLVERPPAFSADGKLLLVCTGSNVSVYSVATGLLVNLLEGHNGLVTSVNVVHYSGAAKSEISHVWTSSMDGTVRFWDYTRGSLIRTVNVGRPIFSMVIPRLSNLESLAPSKQCIGLLLVQYDKCVHGIQKDEELNEQNGEMNGKKKNQVDEPSYRVVLHNLTNGKLISGQLAQVSTPQLLVCSQLGGLVGMVDHRKIWVWRVSKKGINGVKSFEVTHLHHTKALQGLAFDPTETLVAGSDSSGRILIWKNVGEHSYISRTQGKENETEQKQMNRKEFDTNRGVRAHDDAAALSTYHWHSDQVNFLIFSVDGAYLFSGGKEAVFVMWQLETGKRQFLPRLGSSLLHCAASSDASIFSVSCADNTIRLVNIGTMAVQKSIQGIKPPVSLPTKARTFDLTMVAIQPGAGSLVFPAEDMSLQFYDALHDQQIGEVQVSPHNYVSSDGKGRDKSEKARRSELQVFVSHVVFSKDSSVMATAECRLGEDEIGGGSCLKFWKRNSARTDFCLNTQIDDPHGTEVSSLAYHPFLNMAVSCCNAGEFKVWIQDESRESTVRSPGWRCRSVGSYQQKPMHCVAFSPDGTLLAVGAEEFITLWNPSSNGLVHVLARSTVQPVKLLYFSPTTQCLISASRGEQPDLTVWSLETLSICWSYHVEVEAIAVDSSSRHFALLGTPGQKVASSKGNRTMGQAFIAVFDVNSPSPCAIWNAQDVKGSILFCLPPLHIHSETSEDVEKKTSEKSHLLFLNGQREYTIFNPFVPEEESEEASKKNFARLDKQGPSAFASIFGKAVDVSIKVHSDNSEARGAQSRGNFLNCPSHLISLSKIGFQYIESLLEKRTDVV